MCPSYAAARNPTCCRVHRLLARGIPEPLGKRAIFLEPEKAPGKLNHVASHSCIAGSGQSPTIAIRILMGDSGPQPWKLTGVRLEPCEHCCYYWCY